MLIDRWDGHIKELGNEFLGEPDGFLFIAHFQALLASLGRKDQELRRAVADLFFLVAHEGGNFEWFIW